MSKLTLFDLNSSKNLVENLGEEESKLVMGGRFLTTPPGTKIIDTTCVIRMNEDGMIVCECG